MKTINEYLFVRILELCFHELCPRKYVMSDIKHTHTHTHTHTHIHYFSFCTKQQNYIYIFTLTCECPQRPCRSCCNRHCTKTPLPADPALRMRKICEVCPRSLRWRVANCLHFNIYSQKWEHIRQAKQQQPTETITTVCTTVCIRGPRSTWSISRMSLVPPLTPRKSHVRPTAKPSMSSIKIFFCPHFFLQNIYKNVDFCKRVCWQPNLLHFCRIFKNTAVPPGLIRFLKFHF